MVGFVFLLFFIGGLAPPNKKMRKNCDSVKLFDTIPHYSTLFDTIRRYSTLLDVNGNASINGYIEAISGSDSSPSFRFSTSSVTGLYSHNDGSSFGI